jgi:stress-induced morphogen
MKDQDARRLKQELQKRLKAKVESEKVSRGRFRFSVVSPMFKGKPQMTRQDDVWKIVDDVLDRESSLDVSLILTFAPKELQEHASTA